MSNQVLVFFIKKGRVLLGKKHAGAKIGPGTWNGYGGSIEGDESPVSAVVREVREETRGGLKFSVKDLKFRGVITFRNSQGFVVKVLLYVCYKYSGRPINSNEMSGAIAFEFDKVPYKKMMPADELFISRLLEGGKIGSGSYVQYSDDMKSVVDYRIVHIR